MTVLTVFPEMTLFQRRHGDGVQKMTKLISENTENSEKHRKQWFYGYPLEREGIKTIIFVILTTFS